jgi:hypothetical protein
MNADLLLDNLLDLLTAVGDVVHLLGSGSRDNDDSILVTNDGISGANNNASAVDHAVALPGLHGSGALLGGGGVGEGVEAIADQGVGVADRAVSDEAANLYIALSHASELKFIRSCLLVLVHWFSFCFISRLLHAIIDNVQRQNHFLNEAATAQPRGGRASEFQVAKSNVLRPAYLALLKAEELDVSTNGFPGTNSRHDEHILGAAQLESLVLGRLLARRLVRANVGALGDEPA